MAGQDPLLWPTVKLVCNRVKEEGEDKVYQGTVLDNYSPATLKTCATQALADINRMEEKMINRMEEKMMFCMPESTLALAETAT